MKGMQEPRVRQVYPWRPSVLKARRVLFWLTLSPIILAALSYLILLVQVCQLQPTGDPLFDKYARAVRNRQAWQLFAGFNGHPATLPDAQLATWEPEFGSDPRYWELRYFCESARQAKAINANYYTIEYGAAASIFLDEAIERGIARQHTLAAPLPGQEGEAEQLALIARMAQAAPDNAYGHYRLGERLLAQGYFPAARSALAAGNAASRNYIPHIFPLEAVYTRASRGEPSGNRFLSGAIIEASRYVRQDRGLGLVWYGVGRERYRTNHVARVALEPQWYEAICRIAAAEHSGMQFGASSALKQEMLTALRDYELDATQRGLTSRALSSADRLGMDDWLYLGSFNANYSALWISRAWNTTGLLAEMPPPTSDPGTRYLLDLPQGFALYMTPALRFPHESRALIDECRYAKFQARRYTSLAALDWSILDGVAQPADSPLAN